jgi:manganese transport protein
MANVLASFWNWNGQAACRYFLIECSLAFVVAFLINVAVVVVAGSICNAGNLSPSDANTCSDLTLQSTPLLLRVNS